MAKFSFPAALAVCFVAAGWVAAPVAQAGVVTFGDLSLAPGSAWSGPDPLGSNVPGDWGSTVRQGSFESGGATFNNNYNLDWGSWSGFAYSNTTNTVTPGYGNQFSSYAGGGLGDANYAMAFGYSGDVPTTAADLAGLPTITLPAAAQIVGAYVSNATYAALSMLAGDSFAKKFGGATGNDADWFKLTAYGVDANGNLLAARPEFYLADYRFSDNSLDYIVKDWTWFDLSALNGASQIYFNVTSSDVGQYGMNTPAYFALDNLTFQDAAPAVPEPGSLVLALCGGAGLCGLRRRKLAV